MSTGMRLVSSWAFKSAGSTLSAFDAIRPAVSSPPNETNAAFRSWWFQAPLVHRTLTADTGNYTLTGYKSYGVVERHLHPIAAGNTAWTGTIADYDDGPTHDGDATRLENPAAAGAREGYSVTNPTEERVPLGSTVLAVEAVADARYVVGPANIQLYAQHINTLAITDSPSLPLTGAYQSVAYAFPTSPSGAAWTDTAARNLFTFGSEHRHVFGVRGVSGNVAGDVYVTRMFVRVRFRLPEAMEAGSGTFTLTGQDATLRRTYNLQAGAGSFALTGTAAGLHYGRRLAAAYGPYSLAGQTAGLFEGHRLAATYGTYALAGQAARLLWARRLTAVHGSYVLAGQAATLRRGYGMVANTGGFFMGVLDATVWTADEVTPGDPTFFTLPGVPSWPVETVGSVMVFTSSKPTARVATITGWNSDGVGGSVLQTAPMAGTPGDNSSFYIARPTTAGFRVDRRLQAVHGTYALAGQVARLLRNRRVNAQTGYFVHYGSYLFTTRLLRGVRVPAGYGQYALDGQSIGLRATRHLVASHGVYVLSGQEAALINSGSIPRRRDIKSVTAGGMLGATTIAVVGATPAGIFGATTVGILGADNV